MINQLPLFKFSDKTSFNNLDPDVATIFKALMVLLGKETYLMVLMGKEFDWEATQKVLTDPKLKMYLTEFLQNRKLIS